MLIVNGQKVDSDQSSSLVFDEGLAFGRGAFETLPVYEKPFWLDEHLERLNRTLPQLGITRQIDAAEVLRLIHQNDIRNLTLKIIITPENLVLVTRPLPAPAPVGLRLLLHPEGHPLRAPLAGLKTLNYLGLLLLREQAQDRGWQDALLVADWGQVLETTTANVFIIQGNRVRTPLAQGNLLPGIVRQFVLGLDQTLDFSITEDVVTQDDLWAADAVFVTNSLIGIQPVREISGTSAPRRYPDPADFPAFRAIHAAYQAAKNEVGSHV